MLPVLIAQSRRDQHPSERLLHRHASLVSTCGNSSASSGAIAGYDVGLVTANHGQWASPEELHTCEKSRVCIAESYNRNTGLKIGTLPQKSEGLAALRVAPFPKLW